MISCYMIWINVYVYVLILINYYVYGVSLCYLYGYFLFVIIFLGILEKRVVKEFFFVLLGEGYYDKYGFIGWLIRCIIKCLYC